MSLAAPSAPVSEFLDWKVEDDVANIRDSAIQARSESASDVYLQMFASPKMARRFLETPRLYWRRKVLEKFEVLSGAPIGGRVIEIGAGTGWCSALLSKKPTVREVFTLEYDAYCVQTLIPRAHAALGADVAKVRRVLGSFNAMKCDDGAFDYVISIGALHHSENLEVTLRECFRVLRPGGWLIASELCAPNSVTQQQRWDKENTPTGGTAGTAKPLTWKDTSNHYYRVCEYEAAAFNAAFDVHSFVFDASEESGGRLAMLGRMARELACGDAMFKLRPPYRAFARDVAYPYFAKDAFRSYPPLYDALMLVLQKPEKTPGA